MNGNRDLEASALGLIRRIRRPFEQIGTVGYRFVALADWLEVQIPRVGATCRQLVRAAMEDLERTQRPPNGEE
jgi:hypothetical protein